MLKGKEENEERNTASNIPSGAECVTNAFWGCLGVLGGGVKGDHYRK